MWKALIGFFRALIDSIRAYYGTKAVDAANAEADVRQRLHDVSQLLILTAAKKAAAEAKAAEAEKDLAEHRAEVDRLRKEMGL